jgi:hypothetical protein
VWKVCYSLKEIEGMKLAGLPKGCSGFVWTLPQMWNARSFGIALHAVFLHGLFRQGGRWSKVLGEVQNTSVRDFPSEGLRLASNSHSLFQENRPARVGGESACGGQNNISRPVLHLHAPTE